MSDEINDNGYGLDILLALRRLGETVTPEIASRAKQLLGIQATPMGDALSQLQAQAQPRADLITPGSTGSLENARPYTFAGRVVTDPNATPADVLARMPVSELESAGMAMPSAPTVGAMISPMAWKATAPEARAMLTNTFNRYPGLARDVLESPQDLVTRVVPAKTVVQEAGAPLAGYYRPPAQPFQPGELTVSSQYARGTATPVHELRHHLNAERVAATAPEDAHTMAQMISEALPPTVEQGSLKRQLAQLGKGDDLLQRIRARGIELPEDAAKALNDQTARAAFDEMLAHLSEASLKRQPTWVKKLIRDLGVNVEKPKPLDFIFGSNK